MYYADLRPIDVANGPGIRVSLFVSGCTHRCEGCFNEEAWDFRYGSPFGPQQVEQVLRALAQPYVRGLSLLGGEPLHPDNQPAVLDLLVQARRRFPDLDVWCYTGYLYEQLAAGQVGQLDAQILSHLTVLVDGPFILSRKDLSLRFRGSDNQRIIAVPPSLAQGTVVLWDEGSVS